MPALSPVSADSATQGVGPFQNDSGLYGALQQALQQAGVGSQDAEQFIQALQRNGAAGMELAEALASAIAQAQGSADTIDAMLNILSQPQYASLPYVQTLRSKLISIKLSKAMR